MLTTWWRQPIQRRNSMHSVVSSLHSPDRDLAVGRITLARNSNIQFHRKHDIFDNDSSDQPKSGPCYEDKPDEISAHQSAVLRSIKKLDFFGRSLSTLPAHSSDPPCQQNLQQARYTSKNDYIASKQYKMSTVSTCSSQSQLPNQKSIKLQTNSDLVAGRRLTSVHLQHPQRNSNTFIDPQKTEFSCKRDDLRRLTTVSIISQNRRRLSINTLNNAQKNNLISDCDPLRSKIDRKPSLFQDSLESKKSPYPGIYISEKSHKYFRDRRISVSGALTNAKLGNFENKLQQVSTSTTKGLAHALRDLGIGFMCKKGLKPESHHQDDFFIARFADWGLYGVFDGHGPHGHHVANFVQKKFLSYICHEFDLNIDHRKLLKKSFAHAESALEDYTAQYKTFDCTLSGTTATIVLHLVAANKLFIAWVGDSRCVLGRLKNSIDNKVEAIALTEDHKPNNPEELRRIIYAGGRVQKLDGDIPHRVFVKRHLYPGLAMSRALGDTLGQQIGISCEPEIVEHDIDIKHDVCLCLSSDGVWEFMSPDEVIQLIYHYGFAKVQVAADSIGRESWKRWVKNEGNVVDDITTEIIFFSQN